MRKARVFVSSLKTNDKNIAAKLKRFLIMLRNAGSSNIRDSTHDGGTDGEEGEDEIDDGENYPVDVAMVSASTDASATDHSRSQSQHQSVQSLKEESNRREAGSISEIGESEDDGAEHNDRKFEKDSNDQEEEEEEKEEEESMSAANILGRTDTVKVKEAHQNDLDSEDNADSVHGGKLENEQTKQEEVLPAALFVSPLNKALLELNECFVDDRFGYIKTYQPLSSLLLYSESHLTSLPRFP